VRVQVGRWAGPLVAALAVLIGVLLIAGYGVPVGVGVLAGLVAGGLVGVGLGIALMSRARAGQVAWDTSSGTSSFQAFSETADSGLPDPMRAMERVQRVDHGPLVRVVAGGAAAEAQAIHVELIAVEIRSTGAIAHVTAGVAPPAMMTASFARVVVEDDRGTAYEAAGFGGNGSMDRMRYEVRFAPAPPPAATELRVRIDAFTDPFPVPGRATVRGPWLLTIPLA